MGVFDAAIVSGIASVAGDVLSARSASDTNAESVRIAQMNNQFNSAEAAKNRDFQEQMADTSMQRRVDDLRRANLNPALAYTQGGAPVTSGATASSVGNPNLQNPGAAYGRLGDQVASAMDLSSKQAQIDLLKAQANKANVESGTEIPATVARIQSETGVNQVQATQIQRNISMMDILLAPHGNAGSMAEQSAESNNAILALKARMSTMDVAERDMTLQTAIQARNDINKAEAIGAVNLYKASDTEFGRIMAIIKLAQPVLSSASSVAGGAAILGGL